MSLQTVLSDGDRRQSLEALRDAIAEAMQDAEPRAFAQLAGQLRQVLREIEELPAGERMSKRDELSQRRKDRRAKASAESSATASGN